MTDITELAQREKFEAWFKSSFHPDKTGPYIKDQLYFAWKAAGAELVEALEKAQTERDEFRRRFNLERSILEDADKDLEELRQRIAALESQLKAAENNEIDARCHIAELESRTVTDWIEHDGKWRPESLGLDELVYLKTRKQELKIPYPAGKVKGWMSTGGDMDVMAYKLASPQASTVTVKLPSRVDSSNVPFAGLAWNCCLDEVERLLAAAGIKVEAE